MAVTSKDDLVGIDTSLVEVVKSIFQAYDKEDRDERDSKKQLWLRLENYFHGITNIYWDAVAKDFRLLPDEGGDAAVTNRNYDKIINIYRAHLESILAALSIKSPNTIFYPSDAEVEDDLVTAKACIKIKEMIEKDNHAPLLLIKNLLILYNQGVSCAYIYNRANSKFGTYSKPIYGDNKKLYSTQLNCEECGSNIREELSEAGPLKIDESAETCEICGHTGIPIQEQFEEEVPTIKGSEVYSKKKTCIEIFSPLFVQIPFYARKQEHIPYLKLRFEQHYAMLKNLFPKLKRKGFAAGIDHQDAQDRGIAVGVNSQNLCTVDCWWVRDWGMDIIDNKDKEIEELKKKFPDGFYAIYIDNQLVEITNESLDAHWHISANPLSEYLHADPLGKPLAPVQDLYNEVIDLQIETFEHAIPETHARADVVDFKKYAKEKAQPGMVYPAKDPGDGSTLSAAFHTIKTASVNEEYGNALEMLDEKAQFLSSAFPSIYGGASTSGSKTAREYTESRAMALQRLGLTWNVHKFSWAGIMSKAVPLYIHCMREHGQDEKLVERRGTSFINAWIKQTELEGNIGSIDVDTDEEMPMSPAQLKGLLTELITLKNENIDEAIYHPQNTPFVKKALGAPNFYIPGSDERDKQYAEFQEMLSGVYVAVNIKTDNHKIEKETCLSFLNSPTGLMWRKHYPEAIQMIEQHYIEHDEAEKMLVLENQMFEDKAIQPGPEPVISDSGVDNAQ